MTPNEVGTPAPWRGYARVNLNEDAISLLGYGPMPQLHASTPLEAELVTHGWSTPVAVVPCPPDSVVLVLTKAQNTRLLAAFRHDLDNLWENPPASDFDILDKLRAAQQEGGV